MRKVWNSAWLLLAAANLFWAGNIVLARGIAGEVPPITLAWLRWTGAFLVAIGFAVPSLRRDLPVMLRHWKIMLLLAATGIASYNTMSYIGLTETTALNVLLLQSATPLIIIVWAFLLFRDVPTPRQVGGVLLSLAGVAAIAAHGSLATLATLTLNPGDVWVLVALAIYAVYCVILRRRPAVHPLSFLVACMGLGSLMILPFMLGELAGGAAFHAHAATWLSVAYMALMPSFIAYLCFNRGIELIGGGPAGQSMHLMPLFGSILAVVFLHEAFRFYHLIGIVLIAGGILLASVRLRRPAGVAAAPSRGSGAIPAAPE
ncbi:DMT family transporter [Rhodopila sp.]|uniref:DMT family transporter n=1 Tax=Rhodopila sp. TaxID=2480087 RepID=UPI002BA675EB|nr:DMT family transporter [Rhodopila sp.]HVZ07291.1 DMT family transporter [Rhodopila sp.]